MEGTRRYLIHFYKKWKFLDFCLPELESLAQMYGTDMTNFYCQSNPKAKIDTKKNVCVYVNLPSDAVAKQIQARSVMIKEILTPISEATKSYEDLIKNIDTEALNSLFVPNETFRFLIEGIGIKIKPDRQHDIIMMFEDFAFDEKLVQLIGYDTYYKIIENGEDGQLYLGKMAACMRKDESRDKTFYAKFDLKRRPYLGPTSTDHELAFLMANQGQIHPGDFVYDPFVGTASIATALQYCQAFVYGSDLDIRVLKGYGVGRKTKNDIEGLDKIEKFDVYTNFKHYEIPMPEFFVQDVHIPMIRNDRPIFDSIVCDPPYGVRAKTQKVGIKEKSKEHYEARYQKFKDEKPRTTDEIMASHITMKEQYSQKDIYGDLLENASKMLKVGGHIVYLFHNDQEKTDEENAFPTHPRFEMTAASKDILTKKRCRYLITMKKLE